MASPRPDALAALADLPAELAQRIQRGEALPQVLYAREVPRLKSHLEPLDALLDGGLPRGHCTEFFGSLSGGRTSCALALLAAATRADRGPRQGAAWIELAEAFDPPSARAAGVELERVLWVRAPSLRVALRASERLLDSGALGLVVLDLTPAPNPQPSPPSSSAAGRRSERRAQARPRSLPNSHALPNSVWLRLRRSAAAGETALLLLHTTPLARTFATATLEARLERACFERHPPVSDWFEGAAVQLTLHRDRLRPREARARLSLHLDPKVPPLAPLTCGLSPRPGSTRRSGVSGAS